MAEAHALQKLDVQPVASLARRQTVIQSPAAMWRLRGEHLSAE
jgi:hypothetical protein